MDTPFQWNINGNEDKKNPSDSDEDYDGISDNQHHIFNH